jgi:uncharacterized membrane protein (DUF2068 family)
MHLNPAKGYPRVFIELAHNTSNSQLWLLAAGAFSYAALRWVEAFGLWRRRDWTAWFSVASGAVYVPVELVEIARGVSALRVGALLVNLAIVAYVLYALREARRSRGAP